MVELVGQLGQRLTRCGRLLRRGGRFLARRGDRLRGSHHFERLNGLAASTALRPKELRAVVSSWTSIDWAFQAWLVLPAAFSWVLVKICSE
ncbi:hypothetical protein [Paenibacillus flagellatus]|uniref:hypothetical protein n=1 Tax=Paenibacillus flagellatus TaxID=2211139 RepID=UPI0011B5ED6F|nr:hypothetical protein [Paenibacillus flagellatus]